MARKVSKTAEIEEIKKSSMSLIDKLKEKDSKGVFSSDVAVASYSTGFLMLDYINGFAYEKHMPDGTVKRDKYTGIIGGTFSTFIGASGTGKTTLAQQIGWNIVSPFKDGILMHVDIEHTAIYDRLLQVTGATPDDPRLILNKSAVSIEDVMKILDDICNMKEELGDDCKYDLEGQYDANGKPIRVYAPTVIILDSLATFNSDEQDTVKLETSMASNRAAQQISQFYNKCLNKMSKYNICIFAINHIKSKIDISMYQTTVSQLTYLRQGETTPRGLAPIYLAQNVFRTGTTKSQMYTMEDVGFTGFKTTVQVVKSKTSKLGSTVTICFNNKIGFDPIYSLLESASELGILEGKNPHLYIRGAEEYKFSRKFFRDRFIEDPNFAKAVLNAIQPYLDELLGIKDGELQKIAYMTIKDTQERLKEIDEATATPELAMANDVFDGQEE